MNAVCEWTYSSSECSRDEESTSHSQPRYGLRHQNGDEFKNRTTHSNSFKQMFNEKYFKCTLLSIANADG